MIKDEKGQALVEYALLLPLLVLFVAMVVSVGLWTVELNRLQTAANAAAQAGALELPDEIAAESRARELAQENGYSEGVQVEITGDLVTVTITNQIHIVLPIPGKNPVLRGRAVYAGEGEA